MIESYKVLAIVPARGGSKGIPMKNLRQVNGQSLVEIAALVAAAVPEIDRRIISTDHPEIAKTAQKSGLDAPFLRPVNIAGDRISDWDVLSHALLETESIDNVEYDIIVMLQPTSPLRKVEDVSGTIRMLVEGGYDSVWSVSETDTKAHPLKQLIIKDGVIDHWDIEGAKIIARQQLGSVYHRNGIAYAITRECLLKQKTIKGARTGAYIVSGENISIDTEWDLELVDFILSRQTKKV